MRLDMVLGLRGGHEGIGEVKAIVVDRENRSSEESAANPNMTRNF